ncbi:MAG: TRAP transporter small permease [Deltaproteobacteria bacterium]|jgi:TRAP-type C4-dicarboxylate transport system permease small subunit|nr:TRAP transporter small permease [Deltaproteobacteria bacterium]
MVVAKLIHKLSDRLDSVCGVLCVFFLTSMVLITGLQVVCRMYFTALAWSEELTRYFLVWSTFLGAACVYKRMGHINVTIIRGLFPPKVQKTLQVLVHLLCTVFFIIAIYYGIKYMNIQSRQLSAAMRIPMRWVYLAIPLGCGIMLLHVLDLLARALPGATTTEELRS